MRLNNGMKKRTSTPIAITRNSNSNGIRVVVNAEPNMVVGRNVALVDKHSDRIFGYGKVTSTNSNNAYLDVIAFGTSLNERDVRPGGMKPRYSNIKHVAGIKVGNSIVPIGARGTMVKGSIVGRILGVKARGISKDRACLYDSGVRAISDDTNLLKSVDVITID